MPPKREIIDRNPYSGPTPEQREEQRVARSCAADKKFKIIFFSCMGAFAALMIVVIIYSRIKQDKTNKREEVIRNHYAKFK